MPRSSKQSTEKKQSTKKKQEEIVDRFFYWAGRLGVTPQWRPLVAFDNNLSKEKTRGNLDCFASTEVTYPYVCPTVTLSSEVYELLDTDDGNIELDTILVHELFHIIIAPLVHEITERIKEDNSITDAIEHTVDRLATALVKIARTGQGQTGSGRGA